jgi:hypothetical protein
LSVAIFQQKSPLLTVYTGLLQDEDEDGEVLGLVVDVGVDVEVEAEVVETETGPEAKGQS